MSAVHTRRSCRWVCPEQGLVRASRTNSDIRFRVGAERQDSRRNDRLGCEGYFLNVEQFLPVISADHVTYPYPKLIIDEPVDEDNGSSAKRQTASEIERGRTMLKMVAEAAKLGDRRGLVRVDGHASAGKAIEDCRVVGFVAELGRMWNAGGGVISTGLKPASSKIDGSASVPRIASSISSGVDRAKKISS